MKTELGARYLGGGRCQFLVWAPLAESVEARIVAPRERVFSLEKGERGYHRAIVEGVEPGSLYLYRLNGKKERPDPASRSQPQGVHGPSQVIDPGSFSWPDNHWTGLPLEDFIFYELHVGAFTPEGTFEAVIPYLDTLKELGVTAVELMPVAQFPGGRNWGYDGVYPFAVQDSYGGTKGLQRLVNACHRRKLAVVLDVVYNHLGPEGNYLSDFGPYFTERYKTPWGEAINFDGARSDEVRRFFVENALYWVTDFHVDALRLDAIHGIMDRSAEPFLKNLAEAVHERGRELGRRIYLIPESDLNDARVVLPPAIGGSGLDAQWSDDFHHALHVLLTGEQIGYYRDFGTLRHLEKAYREGFVYSGQYSEFRQRRHGNSSERVAAHQFVVFAQNHDQVGNRMLGERLSQLVSFEQLKLAAGIVLLSPFLPLLFMGEEYGEPAPFQYFISHDDANLVEAVRRGRREEFAAFRWQGEPPDPQALETFAQSCLHHDLRGQEPHKTLWEFYREIIRLRRNLPGLARLSKECTEAKGFEEERVLFVRRWDGPNQVFLAYNFSDASVSVHLPVPSGVWQKRLDSAEKRWLGATSTADEILDSTGEGTLSLAPHSFVLFERQK